MTTSSRLTADELSALESDGYVVRESVFTRDEVAEITNACEELVDRIVAARNGRRYTVGSYTFEPDLESEVTVKWEGDTDAVHGLEPFAHLAPDLEKWAYDPRFIEPMIDVIDDPEPVLFTEKLNLKRPQVGGVNPLHQDFPYWDDFADDPARIATSILFLDDADLENGTVQVVPGSHK
jgi:ectoine hydroxylase-related dioxygenase (phytanoyl-CoA dioxygenase family)